MEEMPKKPEPLGNNGDQVVLKDNNGVEVDYVAYENFASGWDITAESGQSLQRKESEDTDTASDWTVSGPSPGTPWWVYAAAAALAGGAGVLVKKKGRKK